MQLDEAILLTQQLIYTGEQHQDYAHTVKLADTYNKLITGKNIGSMLVRLVKREDPELFKQRIELTEAITPAVASSIRNPFNQVLRIADERVRKDLKLKTEGRINIVNDMAAGFYGDPRKKVNGLNEWMNKRFPSLTFSDPNTWVVGEWDAPENAATVIKPRPFEVPACWAWNFKVINGATKWVWVKQPISYMEMSATTSTRSKQAGKMNNAQGLAGQAIVIDKPGVVGSLMGQCAKKSGYRWTLYDEDITIVYEQVDPKYLEKTEYEFKEGETLVQISNIYYLVKVAYPNIGYVAAYRIGYMFDEETNGRTFVNPWHAALCFFKKSLKTVSELDLTVSLHTFPQKWQYVSKCQGEGKGKSCQEGRLLGTGEECKVCKGTGYKIHTSAQDAIFLPMPESKDQMYDLDKMSAYKAPPIDTVDFQNKYAIQLEQQAMRAVFSNSVVIQTSGPVSTASSAPTATGAEIDIQGVYNAIQPFTEQYSNLYKEFMTLFALLSGEDLQNITVVHEFPADFKMKTLLMLLDELKKAMDSAAPQFLVESLNDDMANIVYKGDPRGFQIYKVKKSFMPFSGKGIDQINLALSSSEVPREAKVLYFNFDQIFQEIFEEDPGFYDRDTMAMNEIVQAKIDEFIQRIDEQRPGIDLTAFRNSNPIGGGQGAGEEAGGTGGNPGDDNDSSDNDNSNTVIDGN